MSEHVYVRTSNGEPITDELIETLSDEAERGFAPGEGVSRVISK